MMEKEIKEKKSNGSKVVIFILVVLLLGACTYIAYDKLIVKEDNSKNEAVEENKKVKEENLDVNSRLIQSLYNKVSTGEQTKEEANCRFNYFYIDKDFYADKAEEEQKMELVGYMLNKKHLEYYGNTNVIPAKIVNLNVDNKPTQYYYTKVYVEKLYKDIYGVNSKLDTSVVIHTDSYGVALYSYVEAINGYAEYSAEGGGTCGPEGSYATLTKAVKAGDEIKIFETVNRIAFGDDAEIDGIQYKDGQTISETNYIYTFKLDSDGMYSFVSRIKEG